MKPKSTLLRFLVLAASSLLAISSAHATTYYWDGNNDTAGFGTADGTWADPTIGTLTSGWSTDSTGATAVDGNSVSITTTDSLNFGLGTTGNGLATGTITVSGTVNSGNMTFGSQSGAITFSGGTINFANSVTIIGNGTMVIGSEITGASTNISRNGVNGTLKLTNTNNSYTGRTEISGVLEAASLANGDANSSIGASGSTAGNLVLGTNDNRQGTLTYTGSSNASTDRLFTVNGTAGSTISNNGSGTLEFTSSSGLAYGSSASGQTRTFTLGGTYTGGQNTFNPLIENNGTNATSFIKSGAGTWVLANNSNSYTGSTDIRGGTLVINSIPDYNTNSPIGKGTAGAAIIIGNGNSTGTLLYTGSGDSTNRIIQVGSANLASGGSTILNNGTGALNFTNTGNFNVAITGNSQARTLTLGGTNGGTISGTIQNNSTAIALTKIGSGTWALSGNNSSYTGATAVQEGNLVAGSNAPSAAGGAFGNASSDINLGVAGGNSDAGLLIGGAFTVGRNVRLLTSNTTDTGTRVLTIGGNTADNSEFSGNIILGTNSNAGRGVTLTAASGGQVTFSGVIQNPTSMDTTNYTVTKAGAGTVVLSNSNTYNRATVISEGTLTITGPTQATNSITFTGGSLGLDIGFPVTASSAAVDLANGTIKVTGSTGAPSYTLLTAASITGTPVLAAPVPGYALQLANGDTELRLVNTGGASPYDTWSGGAAFDADANGDGVDNGLAFLLGASGPNMSALDKLPVPTQSAGALVLTFQMLDDTANGNATLAIEYSNSLAEGSWTAVQVPYSNGTVDEIVFNVTGTGPLNVTATIPVSKAAGGKLFGRLKAVNP